MVSANTCHTNIPGYFVDRFTINDNGTVTDNMTGLTWMRCTFGDTWDAELKTCTPYDILETDDGPVDVYGIRLTWKEALNHVEALNTTGGFANKT